MMGGRRTEESMMGRRWIGWILSGLVAFALVGGWFVPRAALAGDSLDVEKWLNRPGVRLLAVEFYATWCKPCMEAVPRWKKLHEKYRDKGLRLVVVAVQDPRGVCVNPGWDPDDVICDLDGSVSTALGVGEALPSALLWSWRGRLLVQNAHVDEVEKKIEEELNTLPRVVFDPTMKDKGLRDLLRAELSRSRKIEVVAAKDEKKTLRSIKKASFELNIAQTSQCKLGEELAANSLLRGEVKKIGDRKKLILSLFSAEKGCLSASAAVNWSAKGAESAVAEAVAELVEGLKENLMMPAAGGLTLVGERREKGARGWVASGTKKEVVRFSSEPSGAMVVFDGKTLCQSTPCSKAVVPGVHRVAMLKESYVSREETLTLKSGAPLHWKLKADFAIYTFTTEPEGVPLKLDGEDLGPSPIANIQLSPGGHELIADHPCVYKVKRTFTVTRGVDATEKLKIEVKPAGIEVNVQDAEGNALESDIYVDGHKVGRSPDTFTVPVCSKRVEARTKGFGAVSQGLNLKATEVSQVQLETGSIEVPTPQPQKAAQPNPAPPPTKPAQEEIGDHLYYRFGQTYDKRGVFTVEMGYMQDRDAHGVASAFIYKPGFLNNFLRIGVRVSKLWRESRLAESETAKLIADNRENSFDPVAKDLTEVNDHRTIGVSGIFGIQVSGDLITTRLQWIRGVYWSADTLKTCHSPPCTAESGLIEAGKELNRLKFTNWSSADKSAMELGFTLPRKHWSGIYANLGYDFDTGSYSLVGISGNLGPYFLPTDTYPILPMIVGGIVAGIYSGLTNALFWAVPSN